MIKKIAALLGLICTFGFGGIAAVKSTTGTIRFQVDEQEMGQLSSTGLTIGSVVGSANLGVGGNAIVSDQLSIGPSLSGSSNFQLSGTMSLMPSLITQSTNLSNDASSLILVQTSGGNVELQLPAAANVIGRSMKIKKTHINNDLVIMDPSARIDQDSYLSLGAGNMGSVQLMSSGTQWLVMSASESTMELSGDNLIAYWPFEEGQGDSTLDWSGRGTTGTLVSSPQWSSGVTGNALLFSGSNHVDFGNNSLYDFGSNAFSISLWARPEVNSYDNSAVMLMKMNDDKIGGSAKADEGWAFAMNTSNRLSLVITDDTHHNVQSPSALIQDQWVHLVSVREQGGGAKLFINGVQVYSSTTKFANEKALGTTKSLKLAYNSYGPRTFHGSLDEVRIYNRAITADEVGRLFRSVVVD